MSGVRKFSRRTVISLLAMGAATSSNDSAPIAYVEQRTGAMSPAEIFNSTFFGMLQRLPYYDSCNVPVEDTFTDAVRLNTEALHQAGHSEPYIREEIERIVLTRIFDDFQAGNVRVLDGWVLSKTEIAICAMIHEIHSQENLA